MPARFYLDQHVKAELAARLRADGHDVLTSLEVGNERLYDEPQLEYAAEHERIMVTVNLKDFKVIAERWGAEDRHHAGLIYGGGMHPAAAFHRWISITLEMYPDMTDLPIGIGPWLDPPEN